MANKLHMIKLVVGLSTLKRFRAWQAQEYTTYKGERANIVRTRFEPKRKDEILDSGGSIYRVLSNTIRCRQKILGFDEIVSPDKGKQCIILTSMEIVPTVPTFKKPFQGWRYLEDEVAPADAGECAGEEEGSEEFAAELRAMGVL